MIRFGLLAFTQMRSTLRLALVLIVSLCLSSSHAAEPELKPVPAEDLKAGLMGVLGESFEYVGGEAGRANGGNWNKQRFWFAKVRAMAEGEFALRYAVALHYPPEKGPLRWDRAEYTLPIKIGPRGGPRFICPGEFGGSVWPLANVGDTLVIPVHVDRNQSGHTFKTPDADEERIHTLLRICNEVAKPEHHLDRAAPMALVANRAPDFVEILSTWGKSALPRSSRARIRHSLTAYLEFKKAGKFNLVGRLADENEKEVSDGNIFRSPAAAFEVVESGEGVTVYLEHIEYAEFVFTPGLGGYSASSSASMASGPLEVRPGDRLVLSCGGYLTSGRKDIEAYRHGIVVTQPFEADEPYTRER